MIGHSGIASHEEQEKAYKKASDYLGIYKQEFEDIGGYVHIDFNAPSDSSSRITYTLPGSHDIVAFLMKVNALYQDQQE